MRGTSGLEIVITTKAFSRPAEYSPYDRRQARYRPLNVTQSQTLPADNFPGKCMSRDGLTIRWRPSEECALDLRCTDER